MSTTEESYEGDPPYWANVTTLEDLKQFLRSFASWAASEKQEEDPEEATDWNWELPEILEALSYALEDLELSRGELEPTWRNFALAIAKASGD